MSKNLKKNCTSTNEIQIVQKGMIYSPDYNMCDFSLVHRRWCLCFLSSRLSYKKSTTRLSKRREKKRYKYGTSHFNKNTKLTEFYELVSYFFEHQQIIIKMISEQIKTFGLFQVENSLVYIINQIKWN